MGFFLFMLVCTLLIPLVMLLFGYRWRENPPKKINILYGFRTARSMSDKNAWDYAHKRCGAIWVKLGWFTALVTVAVMAVLAVFTMDVAVVGIVGGIVVCVQIIPMLVPLFLVERELKQEFGDEAR